MAFRINPIAAEASRNALVENDGSAAFDANASASRAALDAEELRDFERSQYYTAASTSTDPTIAAVPATPAARRTLIARLFRRG